MEKKCLVAYFSATGTTKRVAHNLAEVIPADLYEIESKHPYSKADLDWNDKNSRCTREWRNQSSRPEILEPLINMNQYDVIFVGYPIWWEQAPKIIFTFLEEYDFCGKTIIPFSTSGGSVKGSGGSHLHKYCTDNTDWKAGKLMHKNISKDNLRTWVKELGLN